MKTLQEQYNLLKEGKGHKDMFMKTARRLFPEYVSNITPYETTVTILKQRQILSEGTITNGKVVTVDPFAKFNSFLGEAKAEEKKPTKEVTDMETRGYDYKNPRMIDNVYGEEFLEGYYAEMKDPKNVDKTVDELKEMVAKNLAKDITYYTTNQAFGIKGIGYQTEVPGLGTPKEAKGKYKASGYGDLPKKTVKESMIKLTDLLSESYDEFQRVDKGDTDVTAKDKGEQETYGAGYEAGEKAEKKKLQKEVDLATRVREIEQAGNVAALEAKINAVDEEIMAREGKLNMVKENDAIAEFINPARIKEIEREIKELEKVKGKYTKIYEKMTDSKKKEVVDETEIEEMSQDIEI
jgi:hypothetical protein